MIYLKSIFYFIVAGLFEIGGGYLVWIWLRDSKSWIYGLSGMVVLALYGTGPLWAGLCCLRQSIYYIVPALGMEGRWY